MAKKRKDKLYKDEWLKGWVAFICDEHGFLAVGPSTVEVRCGEATDIGRKCNKIAKKSNGTYGDRKE